jgi:hypothetical protein
VTTSQDIVSEISAIEYGSNHAQQTNAPYVLDAQQIQDLTETVSRLKAQQDEGVEDTTGAQASLHFGAYGGQMRHISHMAVAGNVREAAHIAEGQGKLDLAMQLAHLADMIEKGEVLLG